MEKAPDKKKALIEYIQDRFKILTLSVRVKE